MCDEYAMLSKKKKSEWLVSIVLKQEIKRVSGSYFEIMNDKLGVN